jgi:hypothetical protein
MWVLHLRKLEACISSIFFNRANSEAKVEELELMNWGTQAVIEGKGKTCSV